MRISALDEDERVVRAVFQTEMCPETGRLHYQGYVSFDNSRRTKFVHELFKGDPKCGLKYTDGNHAEMYKYCTKEESRVENGFTFEKGDFPKKAQGKR